MAIIPDYKFTQLVQTGQLRVDPYFGAFQGPNCYHCHLGKRFFRVVDGDAIVDPLDKSSIDRAFVPLETDKPIMVNPGEFILAETFEYLGTSDRYVIKLLNSSSLARVGISQAALGMINAGCGSSQPVKITLELINNLSRPVVLTPTKIDKDGRIIWGTEVLKISAMPMTEKPKISYNEWKYAAYGKDKSVTLSKMANRFSGSENLFLKSDSLIWREYGKNIKDKI